MSEFKQILAFLDPAQASGAAIIALALIVAGVILSKLMHGLLKEIIRHDKSERIDQITISFISHLAVLFTWIFLLTFYAHILAKETLKAFSRCIPLAIGAVVHHFCAIKTCGRFITIWGSVPATTQNPHDDFIKTKGRILSPIWTPIDNFIVTNLPQIGYRQRAFHSPYETLDQGAYSLPLWNR